MKIIQKTIQTENHVNIQTTVLDIIPGTEIIDSDIIMIHTEHTWWMEMSGPGSYTYITLPKNWIGY